LGLWRRVLDFVAFEQVPEGQVKLFGALRPPWVVVSGQKQGLCHVTQRLFHRLVSNLDCVPKDASANPCGKGREISLLGRLGVVPHPGVDLTLSGISGPVFPGR
jgi:hypothetical protein